MGTDLTGGLSDELEYVFAARPDNPEMRESVNVWLWDRGERVGIPRIGIEAVASRWDAHDVQVNIATGDGRVFSRYGVGDAHDPLDAQGRATTLGAGPLSFECVEPFRHWRMRYDGVVHEWTCDEQIAGGQPQGDPSVRVQVEVDLHSAVPPWVNGGLLPEVKRILEEQDEGALIGGPRFEQLARAQGTVTIGDAEHRIDGGALRIRRRGIRRLGTFRGHAWQSAVFDSGRAFGYLVFPEREDGLPTYNEGFLFEGDGELIPAWVVEAPWLRRLRQGGEDVSVVIESDRGTTTIEAETVMSTFMVMGDVGPGTEGYPVLEQAVTRFRWDGEAANGMLERSLPGNLIEA
ncbi:MAG: hypothetical protein F4X38_00075 [Acidimicrobiaceae bacterium]|nr:hypothetical protein [Acidimicrobiaceae bacterium]